MIDNLFQIKYNVDVFIMDKPFPVPEPVAQLAFPTGKLSAVYIILRPLQFAKWSAKICSFCQHAAILIHHDNEGEECIMFEVLGSQRFKLRIQSRLVTLSSYPAAKYVGKTSLSIEQILKLVETYNEIHRYYTLFGTNCQSFVNWLAFTILQYPTKTKLSSKGKFAIIKWLDARKEKNGKKQEQIMNVMDTIMLLLQIYHFISVL